jgi:hypothetical protein
MFLLDDILLSPLKGLVAVCQRVEQAARQDLENQEKGNMIALTELHHRIESGEIDENEFELEETHLLEAIERLGKILHPQNETEDASHAMPSQR